MPHAGPNRTGIRSTPTSVRTVLKKHSILRMIYDQKYLLLMSLPFVLWVILFKYVPIWGWTMAFQNYMPGRSAADIPWVGLRHFTSFFKSIDFYRIMRNTVGISLLDLVLGFPAPIIFALFLNEAKHKLFKRSLQTISYLPHFVSWVVVAGIVTGLLSTQGGAINGILLSLGVIDKPVLFLAKPKLFWLILTLSSLWKETGWGSIIYLAAMGSINNELYEAADIDGASRFKKMRYVTIPGILPTISILLVMRLGNIISVGFERPMLLGNSIVKDYSDVLALYVLNYGLAIGRYSYGIAVGMFESIISIIMILMANRVIKRSGIGSLF